MINNINTHYMKKKSQILIRSCLILAFLNLVWLGFNSYQYLTDIPVIYKNPTINAVISFGLLLFFISHLTILIATIKSLKLSKKLSFPGIILLVFGAISFILTFFQFLALEEIEDNIIYGYSYNGMLKLLWLTVIFHTTFYLFSIIYFFFLLRSLSTNVVAVKSVFREKIFISAHIIGVVCSLLGILIVAIFFQTYNTLHFLSRFLIIPYGLVLLPYLLALGGWGICFIKDQLSGSRDEKQLADLSKAGMIALTVSSAMIIGFTIYSFQKADTRYVWYYFSGEMPVLWLPLILFITLLTFSASSLYNYKLN